MNTSIFAIEKQESLAQDSFTKNGVKKQLHVVAKAIPFILRVSSSSIGLHSAPISTKLFYDDDNNDEAGVPECNREVEALKAVPIEYVSHVNKEGKAAAVEIKLNVLSSQHEGAFFRVLVSVTDPKTKKSHSALSHPIKVISKRNQAKRIVSKAASVVAPAPTHHENETNNATPAASYPTKRSAVDLIAESMLRLERQQQEQSRLIDLLVRKQFSTEAKSEPFVFTPLDQNTDFEASFKNFISSYSALDETERPSKIRKVIKESSQQEVQAMRNFIGVYDALANGGRYDNHLSSSPSPIQQELIPDDGNGANIDLDLLQDLSNIGVDSDVDPYGYSHHNVESDSLESDIYSDMLSSPQIMFNAYQDQTGEGLNMVDLLSQ